MPRLSIAAVISSGAVDPQRRCRLFSLPPELRNCVVYELVLTVKLSIDSGKVEIAGRDDESIAPGALSLLQTCRVVYSEAHGVFYKTNHLKIEYSWGRESHGFREFVRELDGSRLDAIEVLTLTVTSLEAAIAAIKRVRPCRRLKHLSLHGECDMGDFRDSHGNIQRERGYLKKAIDELPLSVQIITYDNIRLVGSACYPQGQHKAFELATKISDVLASLLKGRAVGLRTEKKGLMRGDGRTPASA
ncbi:uncharacterized protein LTR77_004107 [Saxophila tyrrhenica]|uniref:Uncharacterized protein n=1 Tax=Saxophila tyrrhenica TaxID=1690608 RepID=A0AAV9PFU2_9PEZI|nr:hypothetical protein LTR77_004107 [Saxophila tyrrhenica]